MTLQLLPATATALRGGKAGVVVIGSSGWLGAAALAMLDRVFPEADLPGRVAVFGSRDRTLALPSGRSLPCRDLARLGEADLAGSLILHFGYLTKDKTGAMSVDDYVAANDAIHGHVERALARAEGGGLFFASSGGVYGGRDPGHPTRDDNPYGWMKLRHERMFATAAERAGVTLVNGRIFSIAGEYINKVELYALGSILAAIRAGGPIRIKAAREVWRSYAYVGDVIAFALASLLAGAGGTLDIAGAEPVEIGDLAALCVAVTGRAVAIERPPRDGGPPDRMIGDGAEYHRRLTRFGIAPLDLRSQVAATAAYLSC